MLPALEWEKRWSRDLVTKVRLETPVRIVDNFHDEALGVFTDFEEWGIKPWLETRIRFRDFLRGSVFRLSLRGSYLWTNWMQAGYGAERAWELMSSIWLDWEKAGTYIVRFNTRYVRHKCLEKVGIACNSYHNIQLSLKAIVRF